MLKFLVIVLLCTEMLAAPLDTYNEYRILQRSIRSPTFKKKPLGLLLGGLGGGGGYGGVGGGHGGGGGGHGGGYGGGNYITNINNYGPHHESYNHGNAGHGYEGGSFAGSAAGAGGHGNAQSQSASFAIGPYTASFSQSQAQSGGFF